MTCPYCRHDQVVHVHGHGQCARCGINIEPCCDGGVCEWNEVPVLPCEASDANTPQPDPDR